MDNSSYSTEFVKEFLDILSLEREDAAHEFLLKNSDILKIMYYGGVVLNKLPLGNSYITDFVVVSDVPYFNSPCFQYNFIEIESPGLKIFNKSGDPSAGITHALRQISDWQAWLRINADFAKRQIYERIKEIYEKNEESDSDKGNRSAKMYLEYCDIYLSGRMDFSPERALRYANFPEFLIISGRRSKMKEDERLRLAEMNHNLHHIKIITYDALIEGVVRAIYQGEAGKRSFYNNKILTEW